MFNRISDKEPASWSKKREAAAAKYPQVAMDAAKDWIRQAEKLVVDHPGAALVTAFLTGATIAWLLRRK
jgi:hypothetical protein